MMLTKKFFDSPEEKVVTAVDDVPIAVDKLFEKVVVGFVSEKHAVRELSVKLEFRQYGLFEHEVDMAGKR